MTRRRVLSMTEARGEPSSAIGGKAAELARLAADFRVPPFACVTVGDEDTLGDTQEQRLAALCREIGADRWAVRSSAHGEDGASHSFAGQLETLLGVATGDIPGAVNDVLASAHSARVMTYQQARGDQTPGLAAAVIVQALVDSDAAGVAFTADPVTGDRDVVLVSAAWGLGEGVVADRADSDSFRVRKEDLAVAERNVVNKRRQVVARQGRTEVVPVPEDRVKRSVLGDAQLARVARLAVNIENARDGTPQDIEWCLAGGELYLLQARPVTALPSGHLTVFESANIVESYPGLSAPLTFSFVHRAYRDTFAEALRLLGVSRGALEASEAHVSELVCYVRGRIYYNILNWYALYEVAGLGSAVPGWARAMGLGETDEGGQDAGGRWQLTRLGAHIVAGLPVHQRRVDAYLDRLAGSRADVSARDLGTMEPHALAALYETLVDDLLAPYGIAVVNDFFAQQSFELLRKLLVRAGAADADVVLGSLFSGMSGVQSVAPAQSLARLAAWLHQRETLRHELERAAVGGAPALRTYWTVLSARHDPEARELRARLDEHIAQYADRTLDELKLETPPLDLDPSFLLAMLDNFARHPQSLPMDAATHDAAGAEKRAREVFAGRPGQATLFSRLLAFCRQSVKNREALRLARTRAFGLVKRVFRALGDDLTRSGVLACTEDIFFLTVDEVMGAVRGHGVTTNLGKLVALRRQEHDEHARLELPARFSTRGAVITALPRVPSTRAEATGTTTSGQLRGIGCAPGIAEGIAKVVLSPDQSLRVDDHILVAPMTDPAWVFLMASARGLVVERGSVLSHTAIIGRELGLPTVVAVADATRTIADGQRIRIDGAAGTVTLLD